MQSYHPGKQVSHALCLGNVIILGRNSVCQSLPSSEDGELGRASLAGSSLCSTPTDLEERRVSPPGTKAEYCS